MAVVGYNWEKKHQVTWQQVVRLSPLSPFLVGRFHLLHSSVGASASASPAPTQENDFGLSPCPGCNRHHQDDIKFLGSGIPINLHLPLLLGGGDNPKNIFSIENSKNVLCFVRCFLWKLTSAWNKTFFCRKSTSKKTPTILSCSFNSPPTKTKNLSQCCAKLVWLGKLIPKQERYSQQLWNNHLTHHPSKENYTNTVLFVKISSGNIKDFH